MLAELDKQTALADFRKDDVVRGIKESFENMVGMMNGHADHENKHIHPLLKAKNPPVVDKIENDHSGHAMVFSTLEKHLNDILASNDPDERIRLGHDFYMGLQRFEGENLLHQVTEETEIKTALHCYYSNEQLVQAIDGKAYEEMSSNDIIDMMQFLFPTFNPSDRFELLMDICILQPAKFTDVWKAIAPSITDPNERDELNKAFDDKVASYN